MAARTSTPAAQATTTETKPAEGVVETTDGEQHVGVIPAEAAVSEGAPTTTLDSDTTKPSTTVPGDGPADTTDPTEQATSVTPQPGDEAVTVGTVNAVKPVKRATEKKPKGKERTEKYTAVRPDGSEVKITRNIETGETTVDDES